MIGNRNEMQKKIIRLVLPIAFGQFMVALVGASDAFMLGRLNQDSMSAVSLASQVSFVFNLFMAAFVIGENMFVAQYFGKRDYDNISRIVCHVLGISSVVAILFLIGTLFFSESIMCIFTYERDLISIGSKYLKIVGASYLFSAISQVFLTVMRNCGAVNLSTMISSVTVLLNILLNAAFIFGLFGMPAMGVEGAALATVIATAVQVVWSTAFVTLNMKKLRVASFLRDSLRNQDMMRRFWDKTAPVLLNELIWGGGFTMYSVIIGHLGADAVAANGIANISKNLVVCLCIGLGNAGSIMVGNELGAEHFEEARVIGGKLTRASIWCGILQGLFLLLLAPVISRAVDLTPTAKEYLQGMFLICSYYLVGKSINCMTIGGIFPAGGDSRFGLFCDAVTLWCIMIPLGCLCAFVWKLPVMMVYFILNLDEIVKLPVVYWHYRKYGWLKNIT